MNTFKTFTLSLLLLLCFMQTTAQQTHLLTATQSVSIALVAINSEIPNNSHSTFSQTFNWWNNMVEYNDTAADFMVADCPETISGFTALGTYNGHNYYLSNNTSTWQAASATAAGNDGYLVSIENAAENEFVRAQLGNVIAFIGYNDADSEGNFQWDSDESAGYTNVASGNTASKDYANMNFWNGKWSFDGPFTARRYVMEIACGGDPEPPNCDVNWTTTSNSITITGLNTPHAIMKLFNPNWSIFYDCFDDCPDPLTLSGLTNGATYHLSYDLFDANWQKICEDVVDVVITGGNPNRPNLNTNNLVVPATATEGSVMHFTFNLNNNGTVAATGSYVINIYANNGGNSTLVGQVPTGNTPIGTIANVPGAVDLSGLDPGNYTLLVRTDDTNQIVESNENDNDSSASFTIQPSNPTDACGFLNIDIATSTNYDVSNCSAEELSDKFRFTCDGSGGFGVDPVILELDIDKNGDLLSLSNRPASEAVPQDFIDVEVNEDKDLEVSLTRGGTDDVIWTRTVTLELGGAFEVTDLVVTNGSAVYDGFFVAGTVVVQDPAVGDNVFVQYTIKLDENGTVEHVKVLDNIPGFDFLFRLSSSYTTSGGYVFDMFQPNLLSFIKFSETGELLWRYSFASDLPSNSLREIELSEDEQFIYAVNRNNQQAFIDKVNTVTGELVYKLRVRDVLGGNFRQKIEGIYLTDDGGLITGITSNDFGPVGEVFNYGKIDANGNAVWTNQFDGNTSFEPLLQTSDGGFLWLAKEGSFPETDFSVLKITSEGLLTPACDGEENGTEIGCDLSYTTNGGNLSITGSGLDAGHVIIKIFSPNWQTIFSCFDDCGSSIDLSGLSAGTYHIKVDLYNSNWQKTCELTENLPVGNSTLLESERVEILYFNATKNRQAANLNWVANNSFKTDYFILERSADGRSFESIAKVPSQGNSDQALVYQSKDSAPMIGTNFYRITQVFLDGSSRESMIKPLVFETDLETVMVFPNPTADEFYLSLKAYVGQAATISIVNAFGEVVEHLSLDEVPETPIRFDASELRSSLYHVMVQVEGKKMITKKVVVVKE